MAATKASIRERRQRLVVLADHLEHTVAPALNGCKFDMGTWGRTDTPVDAKKFNLDRAHECGYTACALGWAITSEKLIGKGIRKLTYDGTCRCCLCRKNRQAGTTRILFDEEAASEFFGISYGEFKYLFFGDGKGRRGIKTVVRKLREVAGKEIT